MRPPIFPDLHHVLLHLSDACNYRCGYCYNQAGSKPVSFERWAALLREARGMGVRDVSFLGGEPLVYERLEELLALARSLRFSMIYVYTNGSLIDRAWIKRFRKYRVVPVVKMESRVDVYQETTQQTGHSLEQVKVNVRACASAGLPVLTFIVLHDKNVRDVEQLIADSLRMGAFPVLERYMPNGKAPAESEMDISDKVFQDASMVMQQVFLPLRFLYALARSLKSRTACGCYDNLVSITPSGDVLPCPYLPLSRSLGNIFEHGLERVHQEYVQKRKSVFGVHRACKGIRGRASACCRTYYYYKYGHYTAGPEFSDRMNRVGYMLVRVGFMRWLLPVFIKRAERLARRKEYATSF